MGTLVRQAGRKTYGILYYDGSGKRRYASAKTSDRTLARKEMKRLEGKVDDEDADDAAAAKQPYTWAQGVQAFADRLFDDARSSRDATARTVARHLTPFFGGTDGARAMKTITGDDVNAYRRARLKAGAMRSTVDAELAHLRRIFILAHDAGKIARRPKIYIPQNTKSTRRGFFKAESFDALRAKLPDWLEGAAAAAYLTGWRLASEIATLDWTCVDFKAGTLRIENSKNGEGKTFPLALVPELNRVLRVAWARHQADAKAGRIIPWVFHCDGRKLVRDPRDSARTGSLYIWVREAWLQACKDAGLPGKLPHDFRRTAVRNLVRSGVSEKVAMTLTGHKTTSIFRRYDIIDENDLLEGAAAYGRYLAAQHAPAVAEQGGAA